MHFLWQVTGLALAGYVQFAEAALECTLKDTVSTPFGVSQAFYSRQTIFDQHFMFYNADKDGSIRGRKMSSKGFFLNDYPEFIYSQSGLTLFDASADFQQSAALFTRDLEGNLFATFVDADGAITGQSQILPKGNYSAVFPIATYFTEKVGHMLISSNVTGGNTTFSLRRTSQNYYESGGGAFTTVPLDSPNVNEGLFQCFAVDSKGIMFLVIRQRNGKVGSVTYDTSTRETPYWINKVRLGRPIPILDDTTVHALGTNSSEGSFLLVSSRPDAELANTTWFQVVHTLNYGWSWTTPFDTFSIDVEVLWGEPQPVRVVWAYKWLVLIKTVKGVLVFGLQLPSLLPYKFEWTDAVATAQIMFRPDSAVSFIPGRGAASPFILAGTIDNQTDEGSPVLVKYSCRLPDAPSFARFGMGGSAMAGFVVLLALLV
ncbi:hypothetical protein BASA81_002267 [Batrachochytrium salamandrivorans]|nr:hypothetical protein BASA81_002267 [Batrachochytrium salamandrivorans]